MHQFAQQLLAMQFITGMVFYQDHVPNEEKHTRIVVGIRIAHFPSSVEAIVDTGAQWCIFDPAFIDPSIIESTTDKIPVEQYLVRGTIYAGKIVRMNVRIEAEYGESPDIDATVFVPLLEPGEEWPHPNFIGLEGFLNRIRFAVDPAENAFYFGPV